MEFIRALFGLAFFGTLLLILVLVLHAFMGWWVLLLIPFSGWVIKTFGPAEEQKRKAAKMRRQLGREARAFNTQQLAAEWDKRNA